MIRIKLLTASGELVRNLRINKYAKAPDVVMWGNRVFVSWNKNTDPLQYREVFWIVVEESPDVGKGHVLPGQESLCE